MAEWRNTRAVTMGGIALSVAEHVLTVNFSTANSLP
jgi:hypothetical protein